MATEESVLGVSAVIEKWLGPGAATMACVTLIATMGVMLVIFEVAGYTGLIHLVFKRIFRVAVTARHLGMSSEQIKICIASVIEAGVGPVARIVAAATIITTATVMRVVFGVAVDAFGQWLRECTVFVTIETRSLKVFAKQRVVRRAVVELGVQPLSWPVAISTVGAHCVLMRLVFTMAVDAFGRRVSILQIIRMTVFAISLQV